MTFLPTFLYASRYRFVQRQIANVPGLTPKIAAASIGVNSLETFGSFKGTSAISD